MMKKQRIPAARRKAAREPARATVRQRMIPTAEATIGPFFPPRYVDAGANDLTVLEGRKARGEAIEIHGRIV